MAAQTARGRRVTAHKIVRTYPHQDCVECGILLSDGYVTGCHSCSNRRTTRLRRGELFTPTGYAGELINNQTGRIVAGTLEAVA